MLSYTLHSKKGVHHYVCADDLTESSDDRRPSYTLHSCKGVHHHVCVDVLLDSSDE